MIVSIFAAQSYIKQGQFITLTYDDDNLPYGLCHDHFAGFMKRLRDRDGTPDVKIHVAGEYGEKSGREHFHFLVYNHRFKIEEIEESWGKGFVYDGTLTPESMKYVSGYINKKGYDPCSGKRPPYGRTSCNLPDGLSPEDIQYMCKTGKIKYNGRKFNVPRNWRNRYKTIWDFFSEDREKLSKNKDIKSWDKRIVKGMMDEKDLNYAKKKFCFVKSCA